MSLFALASAAGAAGAGLVHVVRFVAGELARDARLAALHRKESARLRDYAKWQRSTRLAGDPRVAEQMAEQHDRHAAELSGGLLARLRWHWRDRW